MLVTCSVIVSDHNVKLAGHFQNLVGQCPMTDCYFQHWALVKFGIEKKVGIAGKTKRVANHLFAHNIVKK